MPITIRNLIISLLKHENLDDELVIKDKEGKELHDITICGRESPALGALFG